MVNWRIAYEFHYYNAFVVAFSSRMSNNLTMIGSTDDFDGRTQERKYVTIISEPKIEFSIICPNVVNIIV